MLLWDGQCGFCRRSVNWVLERDELGVLAALPYQDCLDWLPDEIRERSERQAHLRSPDGRYWGGGAAFSRMAGLLGHPILERLCTVPPFREIIELGYRWMAGHRTLISRLVPPRKR